MITIETDGSGKLVTYEKGNTLSEQNPDRYDLLKDEEREQFLADTRFIEYVQKCLQHRYTRMSSEADRKLSQLLIPDTAVIYASVLNALCSGAYSISLDPRVEFDPQFEISVQQILQTGRRPERTRPKDWWILRALRRRFSKGN